jgi:ADP-ribosylglycohydrolase
MTSLTRKERIAGGLVGMIVGDALGVPYEFHSPEDIPEHGNIEFDPPKDFRRSHCGVPPGTYSDDSAQALILLHSLLKFDRFNIEDFADGLVAWHDNGFMAVDGIVFDVGIQTRKAILDLKKGSVPEYCGGIDEFSNGNGSLMRVLPVALWHRGSDEELVEIADLQSCVTHRHPRSRLCCELYCLWVKNIIHDVPEPWEKAVSFLKDFYYKHDDKMSELTSKILSFKFTEVRGSGYVIDSLVSARVLNEKESYEEVVRAAIQLGNDTDTTACIAGGIAGIRLGVGGIPEKWRNSLRGKEIFEPLLEKLLWRFE